jgi:hypothetical protein
MSIPVTKIILKTSKTIAIIYSNTCANVWDEADKRLKGWIKDHGSNVDFSYIIMYKDGYNLEGSEKLTIGCNINLKGLVKNMAHYYAGKSCPQHMSDQRYNSIIAERKNSMQQFVSTYEH